MNRRRAFVLASVAVLATVGSVACGGSDDVVTLPGRLPAGAMDYTGYDETGQPVVHGWIRINFITIQVVPAPPLDGDWELQALVDPSTLGPQVGSGKLSGKFQGDDLVVSLNPGSADNDVELAGKVTFGGPAKSRYEGRWTWNTLSGPRSTGSFVAVEP